MLPSDISTATPRLYLKPEGLAPVRTADGGGGIDIGGISGIFDAAKLIVATAGRDGSHIPSTRATVRDETSLSGLAEQYGTTVQQLILLNKNNPGIFDLRKGDTIRVPLNRQVVEVQEGDTLRSLARTYGVSVDQIVKANGLLGGELPPPGSDIVLVPPTAYGLGTKASAKAFIADIKTLEHQWNALEPSERLQALEDAINERLATRGVPPVDLVIDGLDGNGVYDFTTHTIKVDSALLSKDGVKSEDLLDLADTVYHEGRHAEQWFDMARIHLAEGRPASELDMPRGVIRAAREAGAIDLDTDRGRFANAMYRSVYGSGSDRRNDVLTALNDGTTVTPEEYADYRRLPEEADAWRVGGMITNLWYG